MSFVQCSVRVACAGGSAVGQGPPDEAGWGGEEEVAPEKSHTNVKNGGAEWIEGRRKPVEVASVDNSILGGVSNGRSTDDSRVIDAADAFTELTVL